MRTRHNLGSVLGLLLFPVAVASAVVAPTLVDPPNDAVVATGIPHFRWEGALDPRVDAMPAYDVQIAADPQFRALLQEDRLAAVIRWYLPDRELGPGAYWWRVAGVDIGGARGPWSAARKFSVRPAERLLRVAGGASWSEIRRTLAAAATNTPVRVVFEKGDYRLDPGQDRVFIEIACASDLILDGGGARFVFAHPVGFISLKNCRRILVKNFAFDFDPPAYTAGRVVAVDERGHSIETEIIPGHALPDAHAVFSRDAKGMVVTEAEGFAMKRGTPLVVAHSGFERIEGRRFRFRFENPKAVALFAVGDIYVLDPRWLSDGGGHGAVVYGGEDVVFCGLTIRGAANECLGSFYADRHAILNVRLERGPGRALSVNNGGNNHHNARTGPWIEGCLFENCGDDVCHVNGYAMAVAEQPAPDRLTMNLNQPYDQFGEGAQLDIRPGDRLQFFQRRTGSVVAEAKVVAATPRDKVVEVTLDRAVGGIVTGRLTPAKGASYAASGNPDVTEIYDASRMCNQFVFRNNVARNSRRIGVLAKGDCGLIERNRFEGLGGGAVEFWNAPFEGLAAENYVVRQNRVVGCGRLDREHAAIWATMFRTGGDRAHRNLLIARNEIEDFPVPALLLRDVENAIIRDNRIAPGPQVRKGKGPAEPMVLQNTVAVRMERNQIK